MVKLRNRRIYSTQADQLFVHEHLLEPKGQCPKHRRINNTTIRLFKQPQWHHLIQPVYGKPGTVHKFSDK